VAGGAFGRRHRHPRLPLAARALHRAASRAGLSETDALIETDRYICLPAQALTYKVGQREIERLRAEESARMGSTFDLRAFHDAVLGHGTLPLATLSRELPGWLAGAPELGAASRVRNGRKSIGAWPRAGRAARAP